VLDATDMVMKVADVHICPKENVWGNYPREDVGMIVQDFLQSAAL